MSADTELQSIINARADKIKNEVLANSFNEKTFDADISREVEIGDNFKVHYDLKVCK